jgi:hypothetical protein
MKNLIALCLLFSTWMAHAQVNPIQIGRSSNLVESNLFDDRGILTQQNRVCAVDSLNLVVFMHRHDVTIFGGGSTENGKFRYDLSTDGGFTFSNEIGTMQNFYTNYGRTPQAVVYNPGPTSIPFDAKLVWTGSTDRFPTPGNIGLVAGVSDITTSSPTSTEHYLFDADPTHVQGGLTPGLPGEFWIAEQLHNGSNYMDTTIIYQGVYKGATQDVDWAVQQKVAIPYSKLYDGRNHSSVPNVAFSPDGMKGYVAFAGDLVGGTDSVYLPVIIQTSDGGATWGAATEVDLNQFAYVTDSLLVGENQVGIEPEFDLTVDVNGNLHFFAHVYGAQDYEHYSYGPGEVPWHAMYDITTSDGGSSWEAHHVANAYTFYGEYGTPNPNLVVMDKQPQISRTEDGEFVFYSWVDSDTAVVTGSQNGIGYGELNNLAPNLRIAGLRVANGLRTGEKRITDGDFIWDGRALYPTMAPTVLTTGMGFKLPIVVPEMITNDQLEPISHWYFGNDAKFAFEEFWATGIAEFAQELAAVKLFPNPTNATEIYVDGLAEATQFVIYDVRGRKISSQSSEGNPAAQKLYVGSLPQGLYLVQVLREGEVVGALKFQKLD